jgi:hypothetical protein
MADAITHLSWNIPASEASSLGEGYSVAEMPGGGVAPSRWRIDIWEGNRFNARPFVAVRLNAEHVVNACNSFQGRYSNSLISKLRDDAITFVGTLPGAHPVASVG